MRMVKSLLLGSAAGLVAVAGAQATIASFTADGLFFGQQPKFLTLLQQMAKDADDVSRQLT